MNTSSFLLAFSLMFIASLMTAIGQYLIKLGAHEINLEKTFNVFIDPKIWGGVSLYVVFFLLSTIAYRYYEYSILYSIGSLSYIWVLFIAGKFVNERIGVLKIFGVVFILIGIAVITCVK